MTFVQGLLLSAGVDRRFHGHAHLEVIRFPDASGRSRTTDGQDFAFEAGDTIVYPPHLRHDRRFRVPGRSEVLRLAVAEPLPAELRRAFLVRGPLTAWLSTEITALAGSPAAPGPWDLRARDLRAGAVLCGLLAAASPGRAVDPDEALVEQAEAFMRERHPAIGRLEEIAAALGVGYDRLRRVFRRRRGRSLVEFLTEVRVQRAKQLLAGSTLSLDEIAARCGYGTSSYLSAVFRRVTGRTPGTWRKAAR